MARHIHMMLAAVPFLAGCGERVPSFPLAELCRKERDGQVVATEGLIGAPFGALCRPAKQGSASTPATSAPMCSFELRDEPQGVNPAGASLTVNVALGAGANRVDKTRYDAKPDATAIADSEGKFLAGPTRIRVTGKLTALANGLKPEETICWLQAEKIERQ